MPALWVALIASALATLLTAPCFGQSWRDRFIDPQDSQAALRPAKHRLRFTVD